MESKATLAFLCYMPVFDKAFEEFLNGLKNHSIDVFYIIDGDLVPEENRGAVIDYEIVRAIIKEIFGRGSYVKKLNSEELAVIRRRRADGEEFRLIVSKHGFVMSLAREISK